MQINRLRSRKYSICAISGRRELSLVISEVRIDILRYHPMRYKANCLILHKTSIRFVDANTNICTWWNMCPSRYKKNIISERKKADLTIKNRRHIAGEYRNMMDWQVSEDYCCMHAPAHAYANTHSHAGTHEKRTALRWSREFPARTPGKMRAGKNCIKNRHGVIIGPLKTASFFVHLKKPSLLLLCFRMRKMLTMRTKSSGIWNNRVRETGPENEYLGVSRVNQKISQSVI